MDRLGRNLGGHIPSCPRHDPPGRRQTVLQVDGANPDGIRFVGNTTTSIRRAYSDVGSDHASVKIEGVPTAADLRRGQLTSGSTLPGRGQLSLVEVKQLWSVYQIDLLTSQTLTCINVQLQTNTLLLFVMLMMTTVNNCSSGICRPRQRRYVAFDDEIAVNADLLTDLELNSDIDNYGSNYCRPVRTGHPNLKNELTLTDVDDITYGRGRKLKSFADVDAPSTG